MMRFVFLGFTLLLITGATDTCGVGGAPECERDRDCDDDEECDDGECVRADSEESSEGEGEPTGEGEGEPGEGEGEDPQCIEPEDCPNIPCECVEGPPVNSRRCFNQRCLTETEACPDACEGFGTVWVGSVSGEGEGEGESGTCNPDSFLANTCGTCGFENCCASGTACFANTACNQISTCVINCVNCVNGCGEEPFCETSCKNLSTVGAVQLFEPFAACMDSNCASNCVP